VLLSWRTEGKKVMLQALSAKFNNEQLKRALSQTKEVCLVEHTSNDSDWGDGRDDSKPTGVGEGQRIGKNWLGKLLMIVRSRGQEKRTQDQQGLINAFEYLAKIGL
jgi:ribA/ribD-fused uncharacterized protein